MRNRTFFTVSLAGAMLAAGLGSASAFDDLPYPPANLGLKMGPKQTETSVMAEVQRRLQDRYDLAAGGPGRLLSKEQAQAAGFGLISDNFDKIDNDKDGFIRFDDLLRFMTARSPQNLMRAQSQKTETIQRIE